MLFRSVSQSRYFQEVMNYWRMTESFVYMWNHFHNVFAFETVISSSWRNVLKTPENVIDVFDVNELPIYLHKDWRTDNVYNDDQPFLHNWNSGHFKCHRYFQIKEWLSRHPEVTNWICFDDRGSGESLYNLHASDPDTYANNVVLVDEDVGFRSSDIHKALNIMKGW